MARAEDYGLVVPDYLSTNVSSTVIRIIQAILKLLIRRFGESKL